MAFFVAFMTKNIFCAIILLWSYDMKKIYVMRHGTTVWNEKGITQGHSNNRLSKTGKSLVEQRAIENKNTKFDVIFCSPLMRTVQTANIMNKFHKVKIIKDERLIEIDQGIFTGRSKNSLTKLEIAQKHSRDKSCKMESYENVLERVENFVNFLKNNKYENVLVVTHSTVASFLEHTMLGNKIDFKDIKMISCFGNAELKKFEM
jgi:probable phosphoglycerate mutase